jgi:hypothetical protein
MAMDCEYATWAADTAPSLTIGKSGCARRLLSIGILFLSSRLSLESISRQAEPIADLTQRLMAVVAQLPVGFRRRDGRRAAALIPTAA